MEKNKYEKTSIFNINFLLVTLNEEEIVDFNSPSQTCSSVPLEG